MGLSLLAALVGASRRLILRAGGLRRVLCALDVEQEEWAPLAVASVMAESFCVPLDAVYAANSGVWGGRTERVRSLIAEHTARERLDRLIEPLATTLEVTATVQRGAAAGVILQQANESRAGLIVLGSTDRRSHGGGSHRLATKVSCTATAAVLTAPRDARACAVQRILVPITSAESARPALKWSMALARRFGASVTLASTAPPTAWFGSSLWGSTRQSRALARHRSLLRQRLLDRLQHAEIAVAEAKEPLDATELAQLASGRAFDLVVLGMPFASPLGSEQLALAERLRRCALVPVLSVRAHLQTASQMQTVGQSETWGGGTPGFAA